MSFEKNQNVNSSTQESERKKHKIVIAGVDIEQQARDIAEEKMLLSKAELKGFRGFFSKIWKHNLAHEYYRQKEIVKARREIKESGNLYAGEKGEKADHENAMNAIVQRFQAEYEGESLLRKGEEKKTLKNDDPSTSRLKNEISDLIKRFASGNLSEEQFQIEKKNIYGEHAPDAKNISVFADNLLEIAKQVKDSIAHGKGLDALDEDYEIVVGRARAGVETEAQYNAVDRITEKIQKSFIGKFVNEATLASAVAIAYGSIAKGAMNVAHRGAKLVGPLGTGLSAGIGGAVAGVRENKRIKEERAQHAREMAKGKQIEGGSKRREEMEKFRYETKNANELSGNLKEALEGLKTQPSEQKLHAVLEHLNEINSRITFSEQEKIDLVSFSDSKDVEKERTNMYIAAAEAKVYLKKNIHADWATFYNNEDQLNEYLQHVKEVKIQKDFLGEKTLKDEAFNKMKRKKVAWAVTKGLGIGLGVGMAAQEIGASIGNGKEGVFDGATPNSQELHYTALGYLRHYITGDLSHDELSSNLHHEIVPSEMPVHEISSHETVVGTKDFIKEHENLFSKIRRGAWADNGTPRPDKNELKLWWGGNEGTGIDKNGNFVFNVKHMTHGGSFHDGKHWDPQELMKEGKMKLLLSLSGDTQNQVIEIPIDVNGNAIIDPNSEIGKIAFASADGHAKFLGKFAEVAVMGEKVDGVEHVNVLATHIGKGVENLKTFMSEEHNNIVPPASVSGEVINPVDYDVEAPFVIPIAGRRSMEQLKDEKKNTWSVEGRKKYEENLRQMQQKREALESDKIVGPMRPENIPTSPTPEPFVGPLHPPVAPTGQPEATAVTPPSQPAQMPGTPFQMPPNQPLAQTVENIFSPEKRNWWEVNRETEVMAIEDLDGSVETFEKHVKELGVAKKDANGNWQWIGGNKKLVFLGDILGDRKMNGVEIISSIENLTEQAEKQGGQIDLLCGNHEMFFIDFLCKVDSDKSIEKNAGLFTSQSMGIWELVKFDPDPNSELKKIKPFSDEFRKREVELWTSLYERIPEILVNMRANPEGKMILDAICKTKVAIIHDDTLYCHTDPTRAMIIDLTGNDNISQRVSDVNKIFQENLRKALFENVPLTKDFKQIDEIYLNTGNRDNFIEDKTFENLSDNLLATVAENLYENGKIKPINELRMMIDRIGVCGHDWNNWHGWLFKGAQSLEIDKLAVLNIISEWEKKNSVIAGDYANEVLSIFNMLKARDVSNTGRVAHLLEEKIKNLNPIENNIEKVKKSGINAIIHGHSPINYRYYDENDFIIVSPHSSLDPNHSANAGISTIQKNGKIDFKGRSFREKKPAQARVTPPTKKPARMSQTPSTPTQTLTLQEAPSAAPPSQLSATQETQEQQRIERELNEKLVELKNLDLPNSAKFAEDLEYVMKNTNGKMYEFHPQTKLNIIEGIKRYYEDISELIFEYADSFDEQDKNERFEIISPGLDLKAEIGEIDFNNLNRSTGGNYRITIKKEQAS